jgi:hypothetical protein
VRYVLRCAALGSVCGRIGLRVLTHCLPHCDTNNEPNGWNLSVEAIGLSAEQRGASRLFQRTRLKQALLVGSRYLIQEVYEESLVILQTALQAEAVTLGCMESVTAHKVSA